MLAGLPFALVALVALVAWGLGGYATWAGLALQLGSLALAAWLFFAVVLTTTPETRERYLAIAKSRRKVQADVEFLTPAGARTDPPFRDPGFLFGFPFRRIGASAWIVLLTLWAAMSLVPLPAFVLSALSPSAHELRAGAIALASGEEGWAPLSVTPFLTLQDLLLWIGYVLVFVVAYHVADSTRAVRRLSAALLLLGAASGGLGLVQWLSVLAAGGEHGVFATGTFGNRNHYAYFQEMLVLVGAGFTSLSSRRASRRGLERSRAQEAQARVALMAIALALTGLGLVFSLSRSGIGFTVLGLGAFFLWSREGPSPSRRAPLAFGLAILAVVIWIGVGPVVERFQLAPADLADGEGRVVVWQDSAGAVRDFWLTGSGLSSFQYVYPIYRSFGGRRFYSWAHNDYLQLAVELGLPGLVLSLALLAWAARRARAVREELGTDVGLRRLHAGYCAALLVVALHSFTDFGLHLPANAALFAIVCGVATGLSPSRHKRRGRRRTPTPPS